MGLRVVLSGLAATLGALVLTSASALAATPETPVAIAPPAALTATTATLKGELGEMNPGTPGEAGTYEFLYRASGETCEGSEEEGVKKAPVPAGIDPGLTANESVSQPVIGLAPATTYSFCLLVRNMAEETAISASVAFTTLAAAPLIAGESVSTVEAGAATLQAAIVPDGAETTYHFEYLTEAQFKINGGTFTGAETTAQSKPVGADDREHAASARVPELKHALLQPGTTYRYRVVAANECETGKECVTDGPGKTFTTNPTPSSEPPQNCSNEQRRAEQASTYLPDCRAYELVTPAQKDSGEPEVDSRGIGDHAAVDGDRMAWFSEFALPGSAAPGLIYLSTRGQGAWSSENVIPPQSVENGILCPYQIGIDAWSADLETGILADGLGQGGGSHEAGFQEHYECGHDEPRLIAGEREGFQNLFVRDNENFLRDGETNVSPYRLVNVTPNAVPPPEPNGAVYHSAFFLAGSADLSHVVFEEELPLTENAPGYPNEWEGHDDLYEWTPSGVRLVTTLPDGTPTQGSLAGATKNANLFGEPYNTADYLHAVSEEGSRVFFQAGGNLYLRENAEQEQSALAPGSTVVDGEQCTEHEKACTIQIDASQASTPGGGEFMEANATGSRVFFTDENRLTPDSTAEHEKPDLYEYDLEKAPGARLSDLTADAGEPADVLGLSGAGEDGSRVYFVARGVLGAEPDRSLPEGKQIAVSGEPNLYAYEPNPAAAGSFRTVFIATLASGDSCDWIEIGCGPEAAGLTARVSANGAFIGFTSTAQLTSYDNTGASEIDLYDAATETLSCASCDPSGAAPTAGGAAIPHPVAPDYSAWPTNAYPQRYVSDNGQVFFTSSEALLPVDTKAEADVYEYEGRELHLISSGASDESSYFLDASVSGSDVFFETTQRLLPRDREAAYVIYDARVNGGFPEPAAPAAQCASGEGCAGAAPEAPVLSTPGSLSFVGAGNLTPAPSKPKTAARIKAEKLASALRACRAKHGKHTRTLCESQARKRYGGAAKAKKPAKTSRRGK
jgi:hypothetical protein